jgi:cytochrome c oxidase subunit II
LDGNEKRILAVAITLLLAFFVGLAFAYRAYGVTVPSCVTDVKPFDKGKVIQRGEKDFEVQMVARMWTFDPQEVVLPPGARVALYLSSADVVHGMQILGTNVNLMAVPGTVNYAEVTFEKEGAYAVICHEYCGRNHQSMSGTFRIVKGASRPGSEPGPAAHPGAEPAEAPFAEFEEHNCLACHTLDGSSEEVAPTLLGLYGRVRELADGTKVTADEAYLRDAIIHPEKQVVKGYDPMPELGDIPEADLEAMIKDLRALGQAGAKAGAKR